MPNSNYSRFCCPLAAARHHLLVAMAAKLELPLDGDDDHASGVLVAMAAKQELPLEGDDCASVAKQEGALDVKDEGVAVDDYEVIDDESDEDDDDAAISDAEVPFGVVDAALILSKTKGARRQRRKRRLWNIMKDENRVPEHCLPPSAVATMKQHAFTIIFRPTFFMCFLLVVFSIVMFQFVLLYFCLFVLLFLRYFLYMIFFFFVSIP